MERLIGVESEESGSEETHEGLKSRGLRGAAEIPGRNRRDWWVKLEEKDRFID